MACETACLLGFGKGECYAARSRVARFCALVEKEQRGKSPNSDYAGFLRARTLGGDVPPVPAQKPRMRLGQPQKPPPGCATCGQPQESA